MVLFLLIFLIGGTMSWSIYYPLESVCTRKCRDTGKPFGRLLGQTCNCYCPVLNPPEDNDPCDDSEGPSCQRFCQIQGYRGGDCVAGGLCWCFCRPKDPYTLNPTTSTTLAPITNATTTVASNTTTAVPTTVSPIIAGGGGGGGGAVDIGENDPVADGSAQAPTDSAGQGLGTGGTAGTYSAPDPAQAPAPQDAEAAPLENAYSLTNQTETAGELSVPAIESTSEVIPDLGEPDVIPDLGEPAAFLQDTVGEHHTAPEALPDDDDLADYLQIENPAAILDSADIEEFLEIRPQSENVPCPPLSETQNEVSVMVPQNIPSIDLSTDLPSIGSPSVTSRPSPLTFGSLILNVSSSTLRPGVGSQTLSWSWNPTTIFTYLKSTLYDSLT